MMYEIWSPDDYVKTAYKIIDKDGNDVGSGSPVEMCYPLRLMKADNPISIYDDKIIMVQGEDDGSLSSYQITINGLE